MAEGRRILLVDDEPDLRDAVRVYLEMHGYSVLQAADGQEAVEKVRTTLPDLLPQDTIVVDDDLTIDFARNRVIVRGTEEPLTATEHRLLYHLVTNAGRLMPSEILLARVWGPEYREEEHYVRLYVSYLRNKLEPDPAHPRYILTEKGLGYRFVDFRARKRGS